MISTLLHLSSAVLSASISTTVPGGDRRVRDVPTRRSSELMAFDEISYATLLNGDLRNERIDALPVARGCRLFETLQQVAQVRRPRVPSVTLRAVRNVVQLCGNAKSGTCPNALAMLLGFSEK